MRSDSQVFKFIYLCILLFMQALKTFNVKILFENFETFKFVIDDL